MKINASSVSVELKGMVISINSELAEELLQAQGWKMEDKASVLALSKKLLVECDDLAEDICQAIDYLQCQVDHLKNQEEILSILKHQGRFSEEFSDIRHIFRDLQHSLMENIRYGKRTQEIDEIMLRLGELIAITNQFRAFQPTINLAGVDNAFSPRCSKCSEPCLSAFRKVQVFLLKLIKVIQATHETGANSKTG